MPKVKANNLTMNYDQQGAGEPLILIPYLAADYACYAFQVADYAKHFTCISLDPRGAGETDKPDGAYSTELFADDVAAFMEALSIPQAHVFGLSLGAAVGMWLAAKYPAKVKTLSLHSPWTRTDPFLKAVVEGWRIMARAADSIAELVILGIFPWCSHARAVRRQAGLRPVAGRFRAQPTGPAGGRVPAPDGCRARPRRGVAAGPDRGADADHFRPQRPADAPPGSRSRLTGGIRGSELAIFEGCAHAAIYERAEEFNRRTLAFLKKSR